MYIGLPFQVAKQATLQPLKAFTPTCLRRCSGHHEVGINPPSLGRLCVEDMPDASDMRMINRGWPAQGLNIFSHDKTTCLNIRSECQLRNNLLVNVRGICVRKVRERFAST